MCIDIKGKKPPPAYGVPLLEKEGSFLGDFALTPLLLQGGVAGKA